MSSVNNIQLNVGESKQYVDTIVDAAGAAVNITNWQITFTMHAVGDPGTVFGTPKTVGSGITLTTPLSGVLTVQFNPSDTATLLPGSYEFTVERTDVPLQLTTGQVSLGNP